MTEALTIEVVDFVAPMVLANSGFLATLATVEEQVSKLTITDAATAQTAADLQSRLTKAAKTLDDQRKALNKPFDDQITAINAAAKGPATRIQEAKTRVARALTDFAVAEQRCAQEAERKRQADLAALQEKARAEKAEADRLAALAIENGPVVDDDWGTPEPAPAAPTATEIAIKAIAAPVARVVRPSGVTIRTTLQATVEDMSKVPDIFIEKTVKLRAIQSTFCAKWKEGDPMPVCGGVKFTVEKQTVSTGR
jgi:hypothetical protein